MVRRTEVAAMSERSIYLRDQADKCLRHARSLTDSETQAQLRKLVAEYFQHAVDLEQEQVPDERCCYGRPLVAYFQSVSGLFL